MNSEGAPSVILHCRSGVSDVSFLDSERLLCGTTEGDAELWDLSDRRAASRWCVAEHSSVTSVQGLCHGTSYLSQGRDGVLKLWDVGASGAAPLWEARTDSCSFARCLPLPVDGGDALDAEPSACALCCPLSEPSAIGIYDCRASPKPTAELVLKGSAAEKTQNRANTRYIATNSLGMCMSLCALPSIGPTHLLSTYESTDACVWDFRMPGTPLAPSTMISADQASSGPAICAAVLWRRLWVACANGSIFLGRLREGGHVQSTGEKVQLTSVPYDGDGGEDCSKTHRADAWQTMKRGINVLAVRPDLRLVAAARWDGRVEMFDVKTATSLGRLRCHDGGVLCASFDRCRGTLATGSEDGRIALWGALAQTYDGPVDLITRKVGAPPASNCEGGRAS